MVLETSSSVAVPLGTSSSVAVPEEESVCALGGAKSMLPAVASLISISIS